MWNYDSFEELNGKTLTEIRGCEVGNDQINFVCQDGDEYILYHSQDCCESVSIEDICGDIEDLLNEPILLAEEVTSGDNPEGVKVPKYQDSFTWTFYKLATNKGYVTIRWYGSSNGYYSETVSFEKINKKGN